MRLVVGREGGAYAFDWRAFEGDAFHVLLLAALQGGDAGRIEQHIDEHRDELRDPYEGEPLDASWAEMLENQISPAAPEWARDPCRPERRLASEAVK
jgi:hypothetical protein